MGRPKNPENMKPGEYFLWLVDEKTNRHLNLEARFVEAAKIWKKKNHCRIPYLNFFAFKDAYYKNLKK